MGQWGKIPDNSQQITNEDAPAGEQHPAQDAQCPLSRIALKVTKLRYMFEVLFLIQMQQVVAASLLSSLWLAGCIRKSLYLGIKGSLCTLFWDIYR